MFEVHGMIKHVDHDDPSALLLQLAKDVKAVQYRLFPLPELAFFDLVALDHAFDLLQNAIVQSAGLSAVIKFVTLGVVEDPGRDAFLDDHRSSTVFILVFASIRLALALEQGTQYRRPSEVRDVG
ncbi:hypothetical protein D3C86_1697690 [compost metagenome]